MVFWVNMLKSGIPNVNTLHGGCPVNKGKKWIVVRFFHEKGQKQTCDWIEKHQTNIERFSTLVHFLTKN